MEFRMEEIAEQISNFHLLLEQRRRVAPHDERVPSFVIRVEIEQNTDRNRWSAFLVWELFERMGRFPCRSTAKGEQISRTDPPDEFKAKQYAMDFAHQCASALQGQFKPWITGDLSHLVESSAEGDPRKK